MRLSRRSRLSTAVVALFSLLFMQLAVAAYACPGLTTASTFSTASHHEMPGCEEGGMEQPSLCHAVLQEGKQSLDKPVTPDVPPFVSGALALVFEHSDVTARLSLPPLENRFLTHATAPPLAIQNCCFRI